MYFLQLTLICCFLLIFLQAKADIIHESKYLWAQARRGKIEMFFSTVTGITPKGVKMTSEKRCNKLWASFK